jgi:RluA family pseudouridine synthase
VIIREQHTIEQLSEETRFVDYCIGLFPQLATRNSVKKAIKHQSLYLNDELATTGAWVKNGDLIRFTEGNRRPPKEFCLDVDVEYEDAYFAIVNKPAGLVVSGNQYRTLENAMIDRLKISDQSDALEWARPVHRLDSATSGLVILAKTAKAHRLLAKLFEERKITKRYHAVLTGKIEGNHFIDKEIDDQLAQSSLKGLNVAPSLRNGHVSFVELSPKTGRTHQLRIHCLELGHPIVGDTIYGEEGNTLLHKGLFLAATRLEFIHPITENKMLVEIEPPRKFEALLIKEERRYKKYSAT